MLKILSAEFLVKYGLPIILVLVLVSFLVSLIIVKVALKKDYLTIVTETIVELFYGDLHELVRVDSTPQQSYLIYKNTLRYVNIECYNIKIDPTSRFIQIPYLIRLVSLILFWGYFCIQLLCLKEIFTDVDQSDEQAGLKCFNVSSKIVGHYFRCEKYGLISLEDILDSMDQIAGILTLNEINKYVFKFAYRWFRWVLHRSWFQSYHTKLRGITKPDDESIPLVSYAQINYLLLVAYLSFSVYENFTRDNHFVPVKFVCYSTLVYSTVLCAYETVKYSIMIDDQIGDNVPVMVNLSKRVEQENNANSVNCDDTEVLIKQMSKATTSNDDQNQIA